MCVMAGLVVVGNCDTVLSENSAESLSRSVIVPKQSTEPGATDIGAK
jgi:hypothetical protein